MPPPLANIKFPEVAPLIPIKKPPKFERRMFSEFVRDVKDHKVKQIELQPTTNTAFYMEEDGSFSFSKYQSSPSFWDILIQSDTIVDIDTSSSVSSELPQIFSSIFVIIGSIVILRALIGIIPGFGGGVNQDVGNDISVTRVSNNQPMLDIGAKKVWRRARRK